MIIIETIKAIVWLILTAILYPFNRYQTSHQWLYEGEFFHKFCTRKILPVLIDIREEVSKEEFFGHKAIHIPITEITNWSVILERLAPKYREHDWLLFVYTDKKEDAKRLMKMLKPLCKYNKKTRCPNAVFYCHPI